MHIRLWAAAALAGTALSASGQAAAQNDTLTGGTFREAVVTANAQKAHTEGLQMGLHTLRTEELLSMPVIFGEPDLVKAIQLQPGVSQGVEGFSGLYVRGGENDQNLFLYDGINAHADSTYTHFWMAFCGKNEKFCREIAPKPCRQELYCVTSRTVST